MKNKLFIILLLAALCLTGCSAPDPLKEKPTLPGEPISSQADGGQDTPDSTDSSAASSQLSSQAASDASSSEPGNDAASLFTLDIPEGFSPIEVEGFALFYAAEDGSNINMNIQDKDPSFSSITADLMHNTLTDAYNQAFGVEVELTDNYFNQTTVDGYPAYQYSITYTLNDNPISQLFIGIDADKTYTFTFTDNTGKHMELFESCAAGIHSSGE